jgi:hypothetical protein
MAYIKTRRSEVCPDIEEERAEFRDADLVYKRLRRRKPSDILAMGQYRSKGRVCNMICHWLNRKGLRKRNRYR